MQRAWRAVTQLGRFPEVLRSRSVTPQWLPLTLGYVTGRSAYPFSVDLRTGPFEFREPSDVPTFWQVFLADLYRVEPTDRVIIDAGANIGAFTLYALLRAPNAHVIAVEPAPDTCERLRKLIEAHGLAGRCTIVQAALSGQAGTTTIQMAQGSQFRVTGQGGVSVSMVTLDSLVAEHETVDLLKLDAEGAEYEALPAASIGTLSRIRRIEMEYHPSGNAKALIERLLGCGFSLEKAEDNPGAAGYGMARLRRRVG